MGLEQIIPAIFLIAVLFLVLPGFLRSNSKSKQFIKSISNDYYKGIDFSKDKTQNTLDRSIITHRDRWDKEAEKKLKTILQRYKKSNN